MRIFILTMLTTIIGLTMILIIACVVSIIPSKVFQWILVLPTGVSTGFVLWHIADWLDTHF